MAPVVHGLAKQYAGQVDFLYLYVGDPRNRQALDRLGFVATPHFFLLAADGTPVAQMRGVVPRDSLVRGLDRLRDRLHAATARTNFNP
jgi:thioredoxin-like negative regulator of GroEL